MSGELTALSLACGIGFATFCYPANDQRVCCGPGFALTADAGVSMPRGTSQVIDIAIDRHPDFDPTLRFQVAAPRGVHATLSAKRAAQNERGPIQLTISADANAPCGCRIVTVVAYSDYKQVVSIPVRVWIEPDRVSYVQ